MNATSRLLIDEYPLMVQPSLAMRLGLNEALILQQIHYWIGQSGKERDGRRWIYNSIPEWQAQFPWWSEDTIGRALLKLERTGLLISANYNEAKFDRTKWYTIDYSRLDALANEPPPERPSRKNADASPQNAATIPAESGDQNRKVRRPIPETNTETTTKESGPAPLLPSHVEAKGDISPQAPPPTRPVYAVPKGTPVNRRPDAPPVEPRPVKTPIPVDWVPDAETVTRAREKYPQLTEAARVAALDRFRLHYEASGDKYARWGAKYLEWLHREVQDYGPRGSPGKAPPSGGRPYRLVTREVPA